LFLEQGKFLVIFPPNKRVADIKNYPSFNLRKEGVQVEVLEWVRDRAFWCSSKGLGSNERYTSQMMSLEDICSDSFWFWLDGGSGLVNSVQNIL
jgi:hypothetical protein